jgi:lysophospholipase L1-like esterase
VFGDSISDEYQSQSYDYARNWVEQLAEHRGVNLGGFRNWGEPRRVGFEFNWSRVGARTTDLLSAISLLPAWEDSLLAGQADIAVLLIGSNDFLPSFGTPYDRIYRGLWTPLQIESAVNAFLGRIGALVDILQSAGKPVLLVTPPDYGIAPYTRTHYPDPARRESVSKVLEQIAHRMDDLAERESLVIVDAFRMGRDTFGLNAEPRSALTVGGVTIDLLSGGSSPTNAFVADGIHPHTVIQGILANLIVAGLNEHGANLDLFSEQELLVHANLTPVTSTFSIDVERYVTNYAVPESSSACLIVVGMLGVFAGRFRAFKRLDNYGATDGLPNR